MVLQNVRLAIVCDWLTNFGGAEKVILALHRLFPAAPIFTSIYNPELMKGFEDADVRTSHLQHFPLAKTKHQLYLAMMPGVFERMDLSDYDIVISSSHSCAKGIITKPATMHVCYCHTPMRYAWEDSHSYINQYRTNGLVKKYAKFLMHGIRIWDRLSADRPDHFIANSHHVQQRIFKYYRKPSTVIHPFVETNQYRAGQKREKFFLACGRLTPYKRFDLLVDTFNDLGLPLKIVGTGIALNSLKKNAKTNIEFLGHVSDETLHGLYEKAQGFIFPQTEDFGITPLEAMAAGCPVIAYGKGGATETIIDGKTGIFFPEQTIESLSQTIQKFNKTEFKTEDIRKQAEKFDVDVFNKKILEFIRHKWEQHLNDLIN
jgi:glycosyltransferase involved in cell wall biosynthesis